MNNNQWHLAQHRPDLSHLDIEDMPDEAIIRLLAAIHNEDSAQPVRPVVTPGRIPTTQPVKPNTRHARRFALGLIIALLGIALIVTTMGVLIDITGGALIIAGAANIAVAAGGTLIRRH